MDDPTILLIPIAIACGAAGIGVYLIVMLRMGKRRSAGAAALAEQHGWQLTDRDDSVIRDGEVEPWGAGMRHSATAVLRGSVDGVPFTSFEYEFWMVDARHKTAQQQTYHVLLAPLPRPIAWFAITPKLTGGVRVLGETKERRAEIEASGLPELMSAADAKGFSLAGEGDAVWLYRAMPKRSEDVEAKASVLARAARTLAG